MRRKRQITPSTQLVHKLSAFLFVVSSLLYHRFLKLGCYAENCIQKLNALPSSFNCR